MLKIGEFSALTGISIDMLRNYDKIGLLKPERVDAWNGYRYYGEKQIVSANRIQVLKGLGFGLKEIGEMQQKGILAQTMKTQLQNKIREKTARILAAEQQIQEMQQALKELEQQSDCALSVNVKKLPARKVVSVRGVLKEFAEEGQLWERLNQECQNQVVKLADVPYCFAITHQVNFEKKYIDTEVLRIVEKIQPDKDGLHFSALPGMEVAAVAYQGIYNKIGDINQYIYRWVKENGYQICGMSFQTYYVSPVNESDPENFITEICFPIQK